MDAVKYFKERTRMMDAFGREKSRCIGVHCNICPLNRENNGKDISCVEFEGEYPETAVEIVEKWSKENPQKTILQDFLEKYPNAKLSEGIPKSCCHFLGYPQPNECEFKKCRDCWNRPLEG